MKWEDFIPRRPSHEEEGIFLGELLVFLTCVAVVAIVRLCL